MSVVKSFMVDRLNVKVLRDRTALGVIAAKEVSEIMKVILSEKVQLRMVFAAAPSQNEFLHELTQHNGIDWARVTVFHMDEYLGLPMGDSRSFSRFLQDRLFTRVKPGRIHTIDSTNIAEEECRRYAKLIREAPIDIVCLGIGENGHIAFNDPGVADFTDFQSMKSVELDLDCRT